jgi:hypothetical protein
MAVSLTKKARANAVSDRRVFASIGPASGIRSTAGSMNAQLQ